MIRAQATASSNYDATDEVTRNFRLQVVGDTFPPVGLEPEDYVLDQEDERRSSLANEIYSNQDARFADQDRRIKKQIQRNRAALDEQIDKVVRHARARFHGLDTEVSELKRDRDVIVKDLRHLGGTWMPGVNKKIARLQATVADLTSQLHDVRTRQYTAGLSTPTPKQPTRKKSFNDFYLLAIASALVLAGVVTFISQHSF